MSKVSIIVPSRNEIFLQPTINDLLAKASGDVEVIAVLDGYWPNPPLTDNKKLIQLHRGESRGLRAATNAAVAVASGEYILKTDAHCLFSDGYDTALKDNLDNDWVSVPTRKRLDAENWCIQVVGKPDINYMYLSFPDDPNDWGGAGMHAKEWRAKNLDRSLDSIMVDDLMSFQGSCWFMRKDYFHFLDLMEEDVYGTFWKEAQEIGFKCWLSGGRVVRNKHAWYAHLHKGKKYGRGYPIDNRTLKNATTAVNRWRKEQVWSKQSLPFSSMLDRFWPVPTWPENWRDL